MKELYKRFRPRSLKHIIGNESTVDALSNMLAKQTVPHTMLFFGPSGCGKTTLARILQTELNCNDLDLKEMNCADHRGIEDIRDIQRRMNMAPNGDCRIWILDEVHMLTREAQNAALKILEDTPEHVYFFLCTTDPQKLLKTIRTRCCEMPVELLGYNQLEKLALRVIKKVKIKIEKDILDDLVASSNGSARSLLVSLDKLKNLNPAGQRKALKQKQEGEAEGIDLCRALIKRDPWNKIAGILKNLKEEPEKIRWGVLFYARSVLLGGGNASAQASIVIDCFKDHFYDSKEPGLALACYEAIEED